MKSLLLCSAGAALVLAPATLAQSRSSGVSPFALSLDAGTTGIGGSLWITASPRLTVSLGYGALDIDDDYSTDEADYSGTAKLANGHALLNWHAFKGSFHFSAGALLADNKVDALGTPRAGAFYEFNGVQYPATLVGTLTAHGELADGVKPYAGVGWALSPGRGGFGFFADLGVMFSGSATVTLAADGPLANDPVFRQNLAQEQRDLQDKLDRYKIYPVVRVGVMYRF